MLDLKNNKLVQIYRCEGCSEEILEISEPLNSLDLAQALLALTADYLAMPEPVERKEDKAAEHSRLDEARRIIEEYAAGLREIIKKLARKMN